MFNTLKELFEKVNFEKAADDNKCMKNLPSIQRLSKNSVCIAISYFKLLEFELLSFYNFYPEKNAKANRTRPVNALIRLLLAEGAV